jgi:hypothetical protein
VHYITSTLELRALFVNEGKRNARPEGFNLEPRRPVGGGLHGEALERDWDALPPRKGRGCNPKLKLT